MNESAAVTASAVPRNSPAASVVRRAVSLPPSRRRPQVFRQQRVCFFSESVRLRLGDQRQPADVDLGQRLLRPFVRAAGVGMHGEGDELLPLAEDLDRRQLEALERRLGAIDEQPLRRPADAQRRGFAKALRARAAMRTATSPSATSMSTAATVPPAMPMPAFGHPLQIESSLSVVGRTQCLVQPG